MPAASCSWPPSSSANAPLPFEKKFVDRLATCKKATSLKQQDGATSTTATSVLCRSARTGRRSLRHQLHLRHLPERPTFSVTPCAASPGTRSSPAACASPPVRRSSAQRITEAAETVAFAAFTSATRTSPPWLKRFDPSQSHRVRAVRRGSSGRRQSRPTSPKSSLLRPPFSRPDLTRSARSSATSRSASSRVFSPARWPRLIQPLRHLREPGFAPALPQPEQTASPRSFHRRRHLRHQCR